MMTVQKENAENLDLLDARFQSRSEANFAIANAIPTFMQLPELRGLWCCSSINESGNMPDLSGQGRLMTNTGPVGRAVDGLVPYGSFTGANYFSRADEAGLDITGALSIAGWWYFTNLAVQRDPVTKWVAAGNQRAYALSVLATGAIQVAISVDGTAVATCAGAVGQVAAATWVFLAARFTPGAEIAGFVNRNKNTNVVAIPAAVVNSTANLWLGGRDAAATMLGRMWICALGAAAWSDTIMNNLFEQSRAAVGL